MTLRLVVNNKGTKPNQKPLVHKELMEAISQKGTVQEKEQVVIENLRRLGL